MQMSEPSFYKLLPPRRAKTKGGIPTRAREDNRMKSVSAPWLVKIRILPASARTPTYEVDHVWHPVPSDGNCTVADCNVRRCRQADCQLHQAVVTHVLVGVRM